MLNGNEEAVKIIHSTISASSMLLLQHLVDTGSFSIWLYKCETINKLLDYIYHEVSTDGLSYCSLLLLIISYCGWNLESETGR
jgi:hypothetical protein